MDRVRARLQVGVKVRSWRIGGSRLGVRGSRLGFRAWAAVRVRVRAGIGIGIGVTR